MLQVCQESNLIPKMKVEALQERRKCWNGVSTEFMSASLDFLLGLRDIVENIKLSVLYVLFKLPLYLVRTRCQ